MADQAVLEELLRLQQAREDDMMRKTKKFSLILIAGSVVSFVFFKLHLGPLMAVGGLWLLVAFSCAFAIPLGTFIRKSETAKFRKLIQQSSDQITQMHTQQNVAYGVKSGTAVHLSTMDGKRGSGPFLEQDVDKAVQLLRQLCPNLRG